MNNDFKAVRYCTGVLGKIVLRGLCIASQDISVSYLKGIGESTDSHNNYSLKAELETGEGRLGVWVGSCSLMALALRLPPPPSGMDTGAIERTIIGVSPLTKFLLGRPTRSGNFIPGFGVVSERVSRVVQVQCRTEADAVVMKAPLGPTQLVEGGYLNWLGSNSCLVARRDFSHLFVKFMANVQLLGILTALALSMGVAPAGASVAGPRHSTGRSLRSDSVEPSSAKLHELRDFQKIEEATSRSGGTHDAGAALADDDEVDEDEFEDFHSKPYEITVPLRIVALRGSVPPAWLKDFMGTQSKRVKVAAEFQGSLRSIFSDLSSALERKQLTPKSAMAADLVTIGDSWLSKAVLGGLIKPIENAEQFEWYQRMGSKWQTFLRRDENGQIDSDGKVWGVPYRWGSLVIAYNRKKLQQHGIPAIKDWADLWRPELAGKISMVASPREIVGAVLKSLGASYNVNDFVANVPGGRQAMKEKFLAFQHQVRAFDDEQYLKTLGAGEVWVAVGWSEDIVSFAKRSSDISVIVPQSGTSLWADLWAVPATTKIRSTKVGGRVRGPSPLVFQWFDFCLQPARSASFEHSVLAGASPLTLGDKQEFVKIREVGSGHVQALPQKSNSDDRETKASPNREIDVLGQLTPDLLSKCEFLEPLSEAALDDFKWLLSMKVVVEQSPVGLLESLMSRFQRLFRR